MDAIDPAGKWLWQLVHGTQSWWYQRGVRGWVAGDRVYLFRLGWTGIPVESVVLNVLWCDRHQVRALIEGEAMSMLRKREERKVMGEALELLADLEAEKRWPALWEHLTAGTYPDGSKRERSSLTVFYQDGSIRGMLRDKDQKLCLWATCKSLFGLLDALEAGANDPDAEWRDDRQAPGQQAHRRPNGGGHRR